MTRVVLTEDFKEQKSRREEQLILIRREAIQREINSYPFVLNTDVFKKSEYEKGLLITMKAQYKRYLKSQNHV